MSESVRLKSYVDAINAETRRTGNFRAAMLGVAIASQMLAAFIFSRSTSTLFSLHNDLIRSNERSTATTKAEMATKTELESVAKQVEDMRVSLGTSGGRQEGISRSATALFQTISNAGVLVGIIYLILNGVGS